MCISFYASCVGQAKRFVMARATKPRFKNAERRKAERCNKTHQKGARTKSSGKRVRLRVATQKQPGETASRKEKMKRRRVLKGRSEEDAVVPSRSGSFMGDLQRVLLRVFLCSSPVSAWSSFDLRPTRGRFGLRFLL